MTNPAMRSRIYWFLQGVRGIFSIPALVLISAFVGFCSYAYESGIPMIQVVFMTVTVWALPAQLILIGAMIAGASLPAAAIAVGLSSMRLRPMTASLIPEIRTKSTPVWLLLLVSHFVAVTSWVFTMQRVRDIPRDARVAFLAGFGLTIMIVNTVSVAVLFGVISKLPMIVAGALYFLTPVYFITSIWTSARGREVYFAMVFGLVLGPVFHAISPGYAILYAGLAGGLAAFVLQLVIPAGKGRDHA